jgi:hypothetical protein
MSSIQQLNILSISAAITLLISLIMVIVALVVPQWAVISEGLGVNFTKTTIGLFQSCVTFRGISECQSYRTLDCTFELTPASRQVCNERQANIALLSLAIAFLTIALAAISYFIATAKRNRPVLITSVILASLTAIFNIASIAVMADAVSVIQRNIPRALTNVVRASIGASFYVIIIGFILAFAAVGLLGYILYSSNRNEDDDESKHSAQMSTPMKS